MRQLPLNILLRDDATFANFYVGNNRALIDYLLSPSEKLIYLAGRKGSGVSHLLQALCHQTKYCLYLPLSKEFSPQILEDLTALELIAIDNIDTIVSDHAWEEALFHLFNQRSLEQKLVIAGNRAVAQLAIQLPDLKSRLQSMLSFTVEPLNDEQKIAALQLRASNRGLTMSDEVAQYLVYHTNREMKHLIDLIEKLDLLSLQDKHKLTVPWLKKVLLLDEARK
jgi:DnaA-homolog protein